MISERRLFLFEADDDNQTAADNTTDAAETNDSTSADNNTEDNTANDDQTEDNNQEENNDDNQQEDNQEDENQNDDNNDENQDEEDGNDDFTINDDDNNDENKEPSEDDIYSSSDDNNDQQKSDALKAKDRELFDSLTLAEQQIKIRELKNNFVDLYNNCISLIDRYNEISLECEEDITHIKKISSLLLDIKGMISFYILNLYDLKSYVENDLIFNRYLAVFNAIKNVTKNINKNNKEE